MAQFKVQVIDETGNLIANKTVEATDYVDACAEVVRQAAKEAGAPETFKFGDKLDGPNVLG